MTSLATLTNSKWDLHSSVWSASPLTLSERSRQAGIKGPNRPSRAGTPSNVHTSPLNRARTSQIAATRFLLWLWRSEWESSGQRKQSINFPITGPRLPGMNVKCCCSAVQFQGTQSQSELKNKWWHCFLVLLFILMIIFWLKVVLVPLLVITHLTCTDVWQQLMGKATVKTSCRTSINSAKTTKEKETKRDGCSAGGCFL